MNRVPARSALILLLAGGLGGCRSSATFGDDVRLLAEHSDVIVIGDGNARIAVVPAWQGRVMTSTARGENGTSFGWLNESRIVQGGSDPQITVFGGEDRFWVGPEGGQFSFYFDPDAPFDFAKWRVPAFIDHIAWEVVAQSTMSLTLRSSAKLVNWSGREFSLDVERQVACLDLEQVKAALGVDTGALACVAYESRNTLRNTGSAAWTEKTGMPSIWILGMLKHGPKTTVVIPFEPGTEDERGPIVQDAYFGKVPADRLVIGDGVLFFRADGTMRTKIGIPPRRAKGLAGSFDAARNVLTIVQYNVPENETRYVNSLWQQQDFPFRGDAINSYNDGPNESGGQLGPFYELETSSPALPLAPGESYEHVHRTIHLEGVKGADGIGDGRAELDRVARAVLGVGLAEIESALPGL